MYTANDQRRRKSTFAKPDTHYDDLTITTMQQSAIGFEESDKDGSGTLSFDEFSKLLVNVHHVAATGTKLKAWFQVCIQKKREEEMSSATFFIVMLMLANRKHGSPLVSILKRHSRKEAGQLTEQEFQSAIDELGFGAYMDAIKAELFTPVARKGLTPADRFVEVDDSVELIYNFSRSGSPRNIESVVDDISQFHEVR